MDRKFIEQLDGNKLNVYRILRRNLNDAELRVALEASSHFPCRKAALEMAGLAGDKACIFRFLMTETFVALRKLAMNLGCKHLEDYQIMEALRKFPLLSRLYVLKKLKKLKRQDLVDDFLLKYIYVFEPEQFPALFTVGSKSLILEYFDETRLKMGPRDVAFLRRYARWHEVPTPESPSRFTKSTNLKLHSLLDHFEDFEPVYGVNLNDFSDDLSRIVGLLYQQYLRSARTSKNSVLVARAAKKGLSVYEMRRLMVALGTSQTEQNIFGNLRALALIDDRHQFIDDNKFVMLVRELERLFLYFRLHHSVLSFIGAFVLKNLRGSAKMEEELRKLVDSNIEELMKVKIPKMKTELFYDCETVGPVITEKRRNHKNVTIQLLRVLAKLNCANLVIGFEVLRSLLPSCGFFLNEVMELNCDAWWGPASMKMRRNLDVMQQNHLYYRDVAEHGLDFQTTNILKFRGRNEPATHICESHTTTKPYWIRTLQPRTRLSWFCENLIEKSGELYLGHSVAAGDSRYQRSWNLGNHRCEILFSGYPNTKVQDHYCFDVAILDIMTSLEAPIYPQLMNLPEKFARRLCKGVEKILKLNGERQLKYRRKRVIGISHFLFNRYFAVCPDAVLNVLCVASSKLEINKSYLPIVLGHFWNPEGLGVLNNLYNETFPNVRWSEDEKNIIPKTLVKISCVPVKVPFRVPAFDSLEPYLSILGKLMAGKPGILDPSFFMNVCPKIAGGRPDYISYVASQYSVDLLPYYCVDQYPTVASRVAKLAENPKISEVLREDLVHQILQKQRKPKQHYGSLHGNRELRYRFGDFASFVALESNCDGLDKEKEILKLTDVEKLLLHQREFPELVAFRQNRVRNLQIQSKIDEISEAYKQEGIELEKPDRIGDSGIIQSENILSAHYSNDISSKSEKEYYFGVRRGDVRSEILHWLKRRNFFHIIEFLYYNELPSIAEYEIHKLVPHKIHMRLLDFQLNLSILVHQNQLVEFTGNAYIWSYATSRAFLPSLKLMMYQQNFHPTKHDANLDINTILIEPSNVNFAHLYMLSRWFRMIRWLPDIEILRKLLISRILRTDRLIFAKHLCNLLVKSCQPPKILFEIMKSPPGFCHVNHSKVHESYRIQLEALGSTDLIKSMQEFMNNYVESKRNSQGAAMPDLDLENTTLIYPVDYIKAFIHKYGNLINGMRLPIELAAAAAYVETHLPWKPRLLTPDETPDEPEVLLNFISLAAADCIRRTSTNGFLQKPTDHDIIDILKFFIKYGKILETLANVDRIYRNTGSCRQWKMPPRLFPAFSSLEIPETTFVQIAMNYVSTNDIRSFLALRPPLNEYLEMLVGTTFYNNPYCLKMAHETD